MAIPNTRMRLTVEVLPLTAENAHGPSRAQAIAEFKARRFALPVQLEDTFERVSSMIAQRYIQNYLRPDQVTSFSIHKLQDAYDCDLDLRDTVGSIFEGENDPAMRMIKVVPGFHDRDFSLPPTSHLVPSLTQKRLRETRPEQSQKRRKIESHRAQLIHGDSAFRDDPIPTTESDESRNGSVVDGIVNGAPIPPRTSRSQTGASMVVTNDAHTGRVEFGSVKEESAESESPRRELFKKPLVPASHEKNRKKTKDVERIRESPALQRAGEDSEVYDTASEEIPEQVQLEQESDELNNDSGVRPHLSSPQALIPAHSPPTSVSSTAPTQAKSRAMKRKAREDVYDISESPEAETRQEAPKPKRTPLPKRTAAATATPNANPTPKTTATTHADMTSGSTATPGTNPAPKRRGRPPGSKDKVPRKSTVARAADRVHREVSLLNNARVQPESPAPSAQSATSVPITKKASEFQVPKKDDIVSSQESDATGKFLESVAQGSSRPIDTPSGKSRAGALKKPSKDVLRSPVKASPAVKSGRVQFLSPKSSPLNASQSGNGPHIVSIAEDAGLVAQLERAASSQSASPVLARRAALAPRPISPTPHLPAASTPYPKAVKQTPVPLPNHGPITPHQDNIAVKSVTPEIGQSYRNLAPGPMKDAIDRRSSGSFTGGQPRPLRDILAAHSNSQSVETPVVHEAIRRLSNSNSNVRRTPVPLPPNMRSEHSTSNGDIVASTPEPTPKPQAKAKASPMLEAPSSINTAIKDIAELQTSPIEKGTIASQESVKAKQPPAVQKKSSATQAPKPQVKAAPTQGKRMTRVEAMKLGSPEDPISISSASPDTSPAPSSSDSDVQELAPSPSSPKAKNSVSQRSQEEDIQNMLASQDRAAPRSSNVSEYRSDPAEEDAISEDEAELEATINERSASAVSSRSSPTMARKPARFLSHSPTPKDQSESESESDSMEAVNGTALPRVDGKDDEDSETDTSTDTDEKDSESDKDTPMPNAPPVTNGTPAIPSTSQPTASTSVSASQSRKTPIPPTSTAPAALRRPALPRPPLSTQSSARRFPTLKEKLNETKGGPLIKPQGKKGPDVRTMDFRKVGKGKKGSLSQEFVDDDSESEESSSSSSSGDED